MLNKKIAIITGGTRGIGLEIVKNFLNNGATVILFGSRESSVKNAIEKLKIENKNYQVEGYYPNLTSELDLKETFETIYNKYGSIDILVNNAGLSSSTPLTNYQEAEINNLFDINMKGVFLCSKNIVPYMEKNTNGGVIINTSSMVSIYGQPSGVLYPASKFFVNGLTKSLARELAPKNIRVNAVAPGITETDMVASLPKEMIEPLIKTIPLGRIGKPEDIANACLFLASDLASYVTGEILQVDGGARS